eukprot:COSAG02_NODE_61241_length_269_cov_0.611765_1_plen_47_part_01
MGWRAARRRRGLPRPAWPRLTDAWRNGAGRGARTHGKRAAQLRCSGH